MNSNNIAFHPIISSIQKVALYETKTKLYLIGSNNPQTRFRVLQIDRREHTELNITDDKIEYGPRDIRELVNTIEITNRARGGTVRVVSAFGIVGFVRFLSGYYVVLITKRRRVAIIGLHTLYKIEDTCMVPIGTDTKAPHPHEQRYVKMFQNIDLSSNFYFSYSYDLTRSLQNNLAPPRFICARSTDAVKAEGEGDDDIPEPPPLFDTSPNRKIPKERVEYGVRNNPLMRYVWNAHLLKDVESLLHPDWLLYITHGFVDQSNMSIFGRPVYVTIIARRSSKFAGTRFLKRGANFSGDVANEVETEQLVHDSGTVSALSEGRFSSFVQMRGSIPGHWSQDISKMVPKPLIGLDLGDAYGQTAGAHFNRLLGHYGSPIIILNLVKKREKKRHESILTEEFRRSVKYLNQFLPPQHRIYYIHFDMARKSRRKQGDVMGNLASIAKDAVERTGIFYSGGFKSKKGAQLQTGVIRVNCVDCLDRTNTAQFAIGKCVLGYQLSVLGFLDSPELEFDSDCVRMLEGLYEDHGDTLALQYGGSQLVHRIKTYRKTAPWTSQGNDIMQTLSRYYSNTFSDNEKQNTINLFLGYFVPEENKPAIWEISTDFYMHNPIPKNYFSKTRKPKTQWWDTAVLKHLPHAFNDFNKSVSEMIRVHSRDVAMIDIYSDYFRPDELTILADMFAYTISHSVRDFMPNFTTDFSPFIVRVRPGRRREGGAAGAKNPSLTGQSSTGSTASSSSSNVDSDSSSDDNEILESYKFPDEPEKELCSFSSLLPSMASVYGTELKQPSDEDLQMYKRYVQINRKATPKQHINALTMKTDSFDEQMMNFKSLPSLTILPKSRNTSSIVIIPNPDIPNDSVECVTPPKVPQVSIDIYRKYVEAGVEGGIKTSPADLKIYEKYVSML